jgi:hypothetical protein
MERSSDRSRGRGVTVRFAKDGPMKAYFSALLLAACAGQVAAAEWAPFSSPKGNFKAVFPAQPQESVQSIQTELGEIPYTTYMSEIDNGNIAFGVAYNDYPPAILQADPQTVLDGGRDGAKQNLGGTVVSETQMTYRGNPGREFTILGEVQGQKLFYHTRIFLIGTRLYQLQIVRVGESPIDVADTVRFFSSFEPVTPVAGVERAIQN